MPDTASFENYMMNLGSAVKTDHNQHTNGQKVFADETLVDLSKSVAAAVDNFLSGCESMVTRTRFDDGKNSCEEFTRLSEGTTWNSIAARVGNEALIKLVRDCKIPENQIKACCEEIAVEFHRAARGKGQSFWNAQTAVASRTNNNVNPSDLGRLYPADVLPSFTNFTPGQEAFGATIDMVVPDMKICLTTAIMNFHARIMPRFVPTRTTDQNNVSITKETLEIYDSSTINGASARLVDLYADPTIARNELQRIIPLVANDADHKIVVKDGILKFGPQASILKLSVDESKPGYDKLNRTDLVEENVLFRYVYIALMNGGKTEIFQCACPESFNRLSRLTNTRDSADRGATNLPFTVRLAKNSVIASNSIEGEWTSSTTSILAGLDDNEFISLTFRVSPFINLKNGNTSCTGSVEIAAGHATDEALISPTTKALAEALADPTTGYSLVGYELDARFSEANLRKTNIAIMTHRVPHSYDIPVGRNYTLDYQIGQTNAEENSANLVKVIGIGQDDVQLNGIVRLIESTYDRINNWTPNPNDPFDYVGADFAAGDKVRPTIFQGTLDFSNLNIIRDSDRFGDVKQKALSYLNGVIAELMQKSFLQQQLGGSTTPTFRMVTSHQILQNVFAPEHIHAHMCKEDQRDLGDGVETVIVLPGGVRIECITCTFNSMLEKAILVPVIPSNGESELNFGALYSNGNMVAHYTISADYASHRLFANIRELFIPTNPVGAIIDVRGLDVVNGLAKDLVLRPTINTIEGTPYQP